MSPSQTPDGQVNVLRDQARRLVDGGAPVLAQSCVVVQASPQTIWAVLTDFERWPAWNPEVTRMTLRGHLLPAVFEWTAGRSHIGRASPSISRLISWTGRTMVSRRRLSAGVLDSGATLVCTAESFDSRLARLFRRHSRRTSNDPAAGGVVSPPRRWAEKSRASRDLRRRAFDVAPLLRRGTAAVSQARRSGEGAVLRAVAEHRQKSPAPGCERRRPVLFRSSPWLPVCFGLPRP